MEINLPTPITQAALGAGGGPIADRAKRAAGIRATIGTLTGPVISIASAATVNGSPSVTCPRATTTDAVDGARSVGLATASSGAAIGAGAAPTAGGAATGEAIIPRYIACRARPRGGAAAAVDGAGRVGNRALGAGIAAGASPGGGTAA